MKHSTSLPIAAAICAALMTGCANEDLRRSVHSVAVSGQVANRHRVTYVSPTTQGIGTVGALTLGVGPMLLAAGINAAIASSPKHIMEAAAASSRTPLEKMVADAFVAEIQRSGAFTLVKSGAGDAVFELEIKQYGLESHGATMMVRARLMKNNECLFDSTHIGRVAKGDRHQFDEYKANPDLLRAGWQAAATDAARITMDDLIDDFDLIKRPPAPAPSRAATDH